jgi:hypothetical protein
VIPRGCPLYRDTPHHLTASSAAVAGEVIPGKTSCSFAKSVRRSLAAIHRDVVQTTAAGVVGVDVAVSEGGVRPRRRRVETSVEALAGNRRGFCASFGRVKAVNQSPQVNGVRYRAVAVEVQGWAPEMAQGTVVGRAMVARAAGWVPAQETDLLLSSCSLRRSRSDG